MEKKRQYRNSKTGETIFDSCEFEKAVREEAQKLVRELEEKYQAAVLGVNCEQLRKKM